MSTVILAIETSCDETAAALVVDGRQILSSIVASQINLHQRFGGVVPEIASRSHLEVINLVIDEALDKANFKLSDIQAVAVTQGPGLPGALIVGLATAKALAWAIDKPLIGVNHLEGHLYANYIEHPELKPPFVAFIVSGGHTILAFVPQWGEYQVLGQTLDDAAGEAFDKVAAFLGLGYPGGPIISKLAAKGNPQAIPFPRALIKSPDYDFSLSGLKTAVLYYVNKKRAAGESISLPDLAASFQAAVVEVQVSKMVRAAHEYNVKTLVLAGGVAANPYLRKKLSEACREYNYKLYYPSLPLCTDNAAMIGAKAYFSWQQKEFLSLEAEPILKSGI